MYALANITVYLRCKERGRNQGNAICYTIFQQFQRFVTVGFGADYPLDSDTGIYTSFRHNCAILSSRIWRIVSEESIPLPGTAFSRSRLISASACASRSCLCWAARAFILSAREVC